LTTLDPLGLPDDARTGGVKVGVSVTAAVGATVAVAVTRGVRVGVRVRVGPNAGNGRGVGADTIERGVAVGAAQAVSNITPISTNEIRRMINDLSTSR